MSDWFSRLTNEHHQPLLPQMLSNRHTLPAEDFLLNLWHRPRQGEFFSTVGQGFNGFDQDLQDQWKDMLQRQMWQQFNSQPGTRMGVNGNFPSMKTMPWDGSPMTPTQMPWDGRSSMPQQMRHPGLVGRRG